MTGSNFTGCVKNAFQATHADISTGNGFLNIVGCPSVYIPGSRNQVQASLVATPQIIAITPDTTAGNSNSFMITQYNQFWGTWQNYIYTRDNINSGATAASEIALILAWVATISNANDEGSLQVTATNHTTYVTIQATTTNPIFKWVDLSTIGTIVSGTTNAMVVSTTAHLSDASPGVLNLGTSTAGIVTGAVVELSGVVYGTINGVVANGIPLRVVTLGSGTSNLYSLDGYQYVVNGDGSHNETGITVTLVATQAEGQGSQVLALSQQPNSSYPWNTPNLSGNTPISGDTYTTVLVNGAYPDGTVLSDARSTGYTMAYYFDEAGANFAAFMAQLILELARQSSAGVADVGLLA